MRVLVCGGRDYANASLLFWTLDRLHEVKHFTTLIHGAARGADSLAAWWGNENNLEVLPFKAEWTTYGKGAGHIRNLRMLMQGRPDLVVAFPGGPGTRDMMMQAREHGVAVREIPKGQ